MGQTVMSVMCSPTNCFIQLSELGNAVRHPALEVSLCEVRQTAVHGRLPLRVQSCGGKGYLDGLGLN